MGPNRTSPAALIPAPGALCAGRKKRRRAAGRPPRLIKFKNTSVDVVPRSQVLYLKLVQLYSAEYCGCKTLFVVLYIYKC